jgi:N utilization substance protein A
MVVSELRGEKIDIIPYNDEPARFVAKALSPARVREVLVDDEDKQATVIVPDDQLSLAIGRDGQNARLAARLTGWRVDIKSETEFSQEDQDIEYEGEEQFDGRCLAVLSNGRRCPNAAVSGSTYCGLPQHQALSRFDTSQVAVLAALSDEDVSLLADSDADEAQVAEVVSKAEAGFEEGADAPAAGPVAEDVPPADSPEEASAEGSDAPAAGPVAEDVPPADSPEEASSTPPAEEIAETAEPPAAEAESEEEGSDAEVESEDEGSDEQVAEATVGEESE